MKVNRNITRSMLNASIAVSLFMAFPHANIKELTIAAEKVVSLIVARRSKQCLPMMPPVVAKIRAQRFF